MTYRPVWACTSEYWKNEKKNFFDRSPPTSGPPNSASDQPETPSALPKLIPLPSIDLDWDIPHLHREQGDQVDPGGPMTPLTPTLHACEDAFC
ncbi:uncharacterized protein PGTG_10550 [Puccinia graminis f. sp. tritici CRL 75-36-700-3]|uniref:Uncharacterized protein n=1 Tax=Puccinia graminis f. sp. tritici (strain CRL 75-36-700-3 / race SCCL) TaxID=418459 RepID=E3KIP7_PUCGT|nr:uncharacterized protein PGTG_10550 [Puccinia graminis f. sp. tritici CRL 75-36-700-3]EFP84172.2 hypothetical protein PGTG_10550 [Puccinia graminis f. sp. tritici CRL 75-36-700-3]